jgi:two-component system KDP operon response regulator KdpE
MSHEAVILIVDDEVQMRRLLEMTLEQDGYRLVVAETGGQALTRAAMDRPELVVLDLGLPDMDGMDVLRRVREWSTAPIIVVSVRNLESDIIAALDAGADDYLNKPFRSGELLARVRTALRHRATTSQNPVFTSGDVVVDLAARTVKKGGRHVQLTSIEYSLLALFVRHAGRVLTHKHILTEVWGPSFEGETQYTRVYVGHLRRKLEDDPAHPKLLITESGIGYRLAPDE